MKTRVESARRTFYELDFLLLAHLDLPLELLGRFSLTCNRIRVYLASFDDLLPICCHKFLDPCLEHAATRHESLRADVELRLRLDEEAEDVEVRVGVCIPLRLWRTRRCAGRRRLAARHGGDGDSGADSGLVLTTLLTISDPLQIRTNRRRRLLECPLRRVRERRSPTRAAARLISRPALRSKGLGMGPWTPKIAKCIRRLQNTALTRSRMHARRPPGVG
jgi:hypothetical protein